MGALYAGLDELTSRQPPFVAVSSRLVFVSSSREHPCGGPSLRLQSPSVSRPAAALAHPAPGAMQVFVTAQHRDSATKNDGSSHQMPMWSRLRFIVRTSQTILASGWSCISHTEPEVQTGNSLVELPAGVAPRLRVNTTKHKTQTGHRQNTKSVITGVWPPYHERKYLTLSPSRKAVKTEKTRPLSSETPHHDAMTMTAFPRSIPRTKHNTTRPSA